MWPTKEYAVHLLEHIGEESRLEERESNPENRIILIQYLVSQGCNLSSGSNNIVS